MRFAFDIVLAVVKGILMGFGLVALLGKPACATEPPPVPSELLISGVSRAAVCTHGYTKKMRRVSKAQRIAACLTAKPLSVRGGAALRIDLNHICDGMTVDHLIPLELGGSNAQANLVAQPAADAKEKDRLENKLHRAVCGKLALPLDSAQRDMWKEWGHRLGKW